MIYDKLVRDKIPEIIEQSGKKAVTRILDDEKFKTYLEKELDEEVAEFHASQSLEELADILEVVYALAGAYGYMTFDVDRAQEKKFKARGDFGKKILLIEVEE